MTATKQPEKKTTEKRRAKKALDKDHGVLVDGRLAYQNDDYSKCSRYAAKNRGVVISYWGYSPSSQRRKLKEALKLEEKRNYLALSLSTIHSAALAEIDFLGEGFFQEFTIFTSKGLKWNDDPETKKECETARLQMYPDVQFSLKGSPRQMVENAVSSLREYARNLQAFARAIERKLQKGEIPTQQVKGFCVVRASDGERLTTVHPLASVARDRLWELHRQESSELEVHAVFGDDSSRVFSTDHFGFIHSVGDGL